MKKILFLIMLVGCAPTYKEFKTLQKENIKITILTKTKNLKLGENEIKVIVEPKQNIVKELFLYMPPVDNEPEKRIFAKLGNEKEGIYKGSIKIDKKGIWDLVIILNDGSAISERIPIGEYDKFGF